MLLAVQLGGCTGREPLRSRVASPILYRVAVRAGEPQDVGRLDLDCLALLSALFQIGGSVPGGRVTVKDRYEMKKKVRALQKHEREAAQKKPADPSGK